MISKSDLRVLLISDTRGNDDEGMKKIARRLADSFQKKPGIVAKAVSVWEAIRSIDKVDIMHYIGGPTYRSVLFLACCKIRNHKLKTLLTFTNPQWNWFAELTTHLLPPDCVIVSSKHWRDWAKRRGIPSEFLCISGVDLTIFSPVTNERKKELRQELDFPLDKVIVLHVGHLKENRNLLALLDSLPHPELQIVIVGSSTTTQSDDLVRQLEAANCIVIRSYQPKIETFYQAADCYIFPTLDQTAAVQIPLSVLEAMATNLPIITSRFGGLMDFFSETKGFTYTFDRDPKGLAEIVKSMIFEPSGTIDLVKDYSWDRIVGRLQMVYHNLHRGVY